MTHCFSCWEEAAGEGRQLLECQHGQGFCTACTGRLLSVVSADGTLGRAGLHHPHCGLRVSEHRLSEALVQLERPLAVRCIEGLLPQEWRTEERQGELADLLLTPGADASQRQTSALFLSTLLRVHYQSQGRLAAFMAGLHKLLEYKDMRVQLCPWAATVVQRTVAAASAPSASISSLADTGLECMAIHCPRCGELLDQDPDACSAFHHAICGAHYCFVCFRSARDSADCHAHVLAEHAELFMDRTARGVQHAPFRENAVKVFLSLLPIGTKEAVLDEMTRRLQAVPGMEADIALLQGVREIPALIPFAEVVDRSGYPRADAAAINADAGPINTGHRLLRWLRITVTHNIMFIWGYLVAKRVVLFQAARDATASGVMREAVTRAGAFEPSAALSTASRSSPLPSSLSPWSWLVSELQGGAAAVRETLRGSRHSAKMMLNPRSPPPTALPPPLTIRGLLGTRGGATVEPLPPHVWAAGGSASLVANVCASSANYLVSDWVLASAGDAVSAARGQMRWGDVWRQQPRRLAASGVKGVLNGLLAGAYCTAVGPLALPACVCINVAASVAGSAFMLGAIGPASVHPRADSAAERKGHDSLPLAL